jgi:hypothetical protein
MSFASTRETERSHPMSAPETNVEKQARRHRGPLVGIAVAVLIAGLALIGLGLLNASDETPEAPPAAVAD